MRFDHEYSLMINVLILIVVPDKVELPTDRSGYVLIESHFT